MSVSDLHWPFNGHILLIIELFEGCEASKTGHHPGRADKKE